MVNYQNSKIYRLDCGDLIYIGSTTYQLSLRKARHKYDYLKDASCRSKLLYQYAVDNGLDIVKDITIELIENYPCNNKEELIVIEGKYIRQFKDDYGEKCVNKRIENRTDKEWRVDNKEKLLQQNKVYYEDNKEKLLQQKKEYYEDNKDKILQQVKEYYENNKEKHSQQKKEYYLNNKEKLLQQKKEYYLDNKEKLLQQRKENYLFKKIDKMFDLR